MSLITTTDTALLRLLQLSSPALPVGAYAFSQGLEFGIEAQWLRNADDVQAWLQLQLGQSVAGVDLPLLLHLHEAWRGADAERVAWWNDYSLACRETAEFRLAELAMGEALARLLPALGITVPAGLQQPGFLTLFARAAVHWELSAVLTLYGYAWSWLENQVMAATKLLPLGQTQAQVLIGALQAELPALVTAALAQPDAEPGAGLPGVALAGALHETQYSRLFRS